MPGRDALRPPFWGFSGRRTCGLFGVWFMGFMMVMMLGFVLGPKTEDEPIS